MKRILSIMLGVMMVFGMVGTAFGSESILYLGDTGEKVEKVQARLVELTYLEEGSYTQGTYDEATKQAVIEFQRTNGLLDSGRVDAETYDLLMSDKATPRPDWMRGWAEEEAMYEATSVNSLVQTGSVSLQSFASGSADGGAVFVDPFAAAPAMKTKTVMDMDWNTNEYTHYKPNGFQSVVSSPLSTFAADVDTSSYSILRRAIMNGNPITADMVRIEEMVNYFHYDYPQPKEGEPFGVYMGYSDCPWNPQTKLLQIGLQAEVVPVENRPQHNLVFLIDTSGSMHGSDRLDLVKRAFMMLLDELNPTDTISLVTYASSDRVMLEGVPAADKTRIMDALSQLEAYGSTNGAAGILRAYELADRYFIEGGVNRILLATDGDLNVGVTSTSELIDLVMEKKERGVSITCLGVGYGNYKDNKLTALANYGDGNCWYLDNIYEARKALVTEADGTFITVASDVKLQVDFNPAYVQGYRLIGYETKLLAAEDFANDEVDGGDVGSGHRVTALYEIIPADSPFDFGAVTSAYQENAGVKNGELLTVNIRAKVPGENTSRLFQYPLKEGSEIELDDNMKFAAGVAEIGMLLSDNHASGSASFNSALELLRGCSTVTGDVYKEEFIYLAGLLDRRPEIPDGFVNSPAPMIVKAPEPEVVIQDYNPDDYLVVDDEEDVEDNSIQGWKSPYNGN